MKRLLALVSLLCVFAAPAFAQVTATPVQTGFLSTTGCQYAGQTVCFIQYGVGFNASGQVTLSASTVTSNVALGSTGPTVVVSNGGAVTAYVALGGSTVTATTSSIPVLPGYSIVLQAGTATYLAGITGSSTAALTITTGTGIPAGTGSPAAPVSGTVTANQGTGGLSPWLVTSSASAVTPKAATATTIVTGGTAVTLVTGPINGGYIVNPINLASQGIAAAENAYIDPVGTPGSTDTNGNGTTAILTPGQPYVLPALAAGALVKGNAATSGHKLTVVVW